MQRSTGGERDVHVLKYFSSFVSVSGGKVIYISEPSLRFCPLAWHLYKDIFPLHPTDNTGIKKAIKETIESKIRDYGFFTAQRKLEGDDVLVPYGASEMLMFALKNKTIDTAVVVCEGAGTVVTDQPRLVQGIGGRMNSLLLTSPIPGIMEKLKHHHCRVVFTHALIDQVNGAQEAIKMGYRRIGVTVSGQRADDLKRLSLLEKHSGAAITSLVVCTTGITADRVEAIRRHADLVWSCASGDIREKLGPMALMQLSRQIPVFVLTRKGVDFVSAYCEKPDRIRNLDSHRQYLVSHDRRGQRVRMGHFDAFIQEARLPAGARRTACLPDRWTPALRFSKKTERG